MSLAGVLSNRGDAYQTLIAFEWALNVLSTDKYLWIEVDSTSLDASRNPILVDDVVIGCSDGKIICCQCKKNQTDFKPWSVVDLGDELAKAVNLLTNNKKSSVKFYTRGSFGVLAKLREYCLTQSDEAAYQQNLSIENRKTDAELTKQLAGIAEISTFEFIRRTSFETSPSEFGRMEELLMERLRCLASNPEGAFDALWTRLDKLGAGFSANGNRSVSASHRLTKADLQKILAESGATFVPPLSQQYIQQSFASASAIGRHWRRDIGGKHLVSTAVIELLNAVSAKKKSVLLTGVPGAGKTCVLLKLQELLETHHDVAALFIQTREYANCVTPEARISQGLPDDLVGQVGRMADCKHTVVIFDSLDVLSLSREHAVLSYFLSLIDRLILIPNVTVIAACRDFDRKYDKRLSERKWDREIKNPSLDWDSVVAPLVGDYGIDPQTIDAATQNLLQNPRELALFVDIAKQTGGFNVATSQALSQKYLKTIVESDPFLGSTAMEAIEQMAKEMLNLRRLDIPYSHARMSDEVVKRLLSAGVLHENQSGNIGFGHQSLLDVLVVSGAERRRLSLKSFIESLPAVPFVRPTIRAYVAYLSTGDRLSFRKQLRAVFDSNAAFHIRRLVAESLAEQAPQDDDWSLIKHLHCQHRELFNTLYVQARSINWHFFWLKFLIPYLLLERDGQSIAHHIRQIALWKKDDPRGVLSFWTEALKLTWMDCTQMAMNLAFELRDINSNTELSTASLIETLLGFPRQGHDFLGEAIARCIETGGAGDELLWRYIAGDIEEADVFMFHFLKNLRCHPNEFGNNDFLGRRMLQSEHLLDLAIASIEQWSAIQGSRYSNTGGWREGFLVETSYGKTHCHHNGLHVSSEIILFGAVEKAILHHATEHTAWWEKHRGQLCRSHEGAISYFVLLALAESPERNIAEMECLLLNRQMLGSRLDYEIGTLLHESFVFLDESVQEAVLLSILTLREGKDAVEKPWILQKPAELLSAIPAHLRSPDTQAMLDAWEHVNGPCLRQPAIFSRGGFVQPPFSYERFLEATDAGVLRILSHYQEDGRCDWEYNSLIGGAEQVGQQLREAASRSPVRFLRILAEHWIDIPNRFTDDMLEGVGSYLAQRYGHVTINNADQWVPIEEPDPQALAGLILDEIERHTLRWHHCLAAANALQACSHVIRNDRDASRLLFAALGFVNYQEMDHSANLTDLIHIGINRVKGHVAETVMIIANQWAEMRRPFPELLVPTLKRFASDHGPAIRALILRRLPYLQSFSPELGWEIFYSAMEDNDEHLWEIAEPCLYYSYHKHFSEVSLILERIFSTSSGKALETWGRISALAALSGHIDIDAFISRLRSLASIDAWKGAATVWACNENAVQHPQQCFSGLCSGLQEAGATAPSVANEMASLFRADEPISVVPSDIVDLYFSAIEQPRNDGHVYVHGLDAWLNALSQHNPDKALTAAESFAAFVRRKKYPFFDHSGDFSQLLTRLFREAEEREEADEGAMLGRVIALQDKLLAIGVGGIQEWRRAAERP